MTRTHVSESTDTSTARLRLLERREVHAHVKARL